MFLASLLYEVEAEAVARPAAQDQEYRPSGLFAVAVGNALLDTVHHGPMSSVTGLHATDDGYLQDMGLVNIENMLQS